MDPSSELLPNSKRPNFFNSITPFSKALALSMLILLPTAAFLFGMYYQTKISPTNSNTSVLTPNKQSSTSAKVDPYANWKTYQDASNKYSFKYPPDWSEATLSLGITGGLVAVYTNKSSTKQYPSVTVLKNPGGFGFCEGSSNSQTKQITISGVSATMVECNSQIIINYKQGDGNFYIISSYTDQTTQDLVNKILDSFTITK